MKDPNFHGRPRHRRRIEAALWAHQAPSKEYSFGVRVGIEEMQAVVTPEKALQLAARLVTVAERAKAARWNDSYAENAQRERQVGTK